MLATKKLSIFSSDTANSLPPYIDSGVAGELNNNLLINKNGISESLNVFLADARPLAVSGDGDPITLYASYTDSESEFYSVYIEFSEYTEDASVIIDTLLGFVSREPKGNTSLCIELSANSIFGEYGFYYYDVADGVAEKSVIEFFKKYGDPLDWEL